MVLAVPLRGSCNESGVAGLLVVMPKRTIYEKTIRRNYGVSSANIDWDYFASKCTCDGMERLDELFRPSFGNDLGKRGDFH